ncbi:methylenetetrahydrofolate reductase [Brevibacterium salitolerans]|uniref:Methylenetetrahydrofolate reductase n=1 Tax=Brevibacterium salitolerans TaxID=1403566 RepID=A0ABP5ICJ8_9MICO
MALRRGRLSEAQSAVLRELLEAPRLEVLPTKSVVSAVMENLPQGRIVTVTASPGMGLERTLSTAVSLQESGYRTVPHLAARMVESRGRLEEIVGRLTGAGVDSVFVPAGDAAEPAGPYTGALDLLRDLAELGSPFGHVGVAGYPESHPTIPDGTTVRAMTDKRPYATHVVSNLCFDPARVAAWTRTLRERGEALPVLIGAAGAVERTRLLKVAGAIGVGESARFLAKNRSLFARMFTPGGFSPERWLRQLVRELDAQGVPVLPEKGAEASGTGAREPSERRAAAPEAGAVSTPEVGAGAESASAPEAEARAAREVGEGPAQHPRRGGHTYGRGDGPVPASGSVVRGLHVYTFNQIAATETWRRDLVERLSRE